MQEGFPYGLVKQWGYYLLPPTHHDSLGNTGLLVALRERPTGKHFDPESAHVLLRDARGVAQRRTLTQHSVLPKTERICPGKLVLADRSDHRTEFFTFGGSLEAKTQPGELLLLVRSPAPLLELEPDRDTIPDHLAAETEAHIAETRSKWGRDDQGFYRRLAVVEPLQVYLAALHSILHQYEHTRMLEDACPDFVDALRRERAWFASKGVALHEQPLLEALLARR